MDRNIFVDYTIDNESRVALRKESVDRNLGDRTVYQVYQVALRKESVDRNLYLRRTPQQAERRSPQGERG